jgi:hypothetical protein
MLYRAKQRTVDDRRERNYEGAGVVRIFRELLYHLWLAKIESGLKLDGICPDTNHEC